VQVVNLDSPMLAGMHAFHCDRFDPGLPEGHRFPMVKYRRLREMAAMQCPHVHLQESRAATLPELYLAHDRAYVEAVIDGSLGDAAWREIGFPWSAAMVERSLRSVGATLEATDWAQREGLAMNLAGGTHHASVAKGSGFCVFNDVAVAAERALRQGTARICVIDLDVHQGNGTAEVFLGRDEVFTLSLHGDKNFPFRKAQSTLDVPLPKGCEDADYLQALDGALATLQPSQDQQPFELAFYLAGADAHGNDRLGHLALSDEGMRERDERVLDLLYEWRTPVVVCMAGGYGKDLDRMLAVQLNTVQTCHSAWQSRNPERISE
jgi:acetoin utilization deacetylase AcuC-like enzyme